MLSPLTEIWYVRYINFIIRLLKKEESFRTFSKTLISKAEIT